MRQPAELVAAMPGLGAAWTTAVGACLGSFVNVVVARLPQQMSVVRPRSHCFACRAPIAWYDNLPLLSFAWLRGRCRRCHAAIGLRTPLTEGLMALLAAALWARLGVGVELLVWLPLTTALVAVTWLDLDYWWVPDALTLPAMGWALATAALPGRLGVVAALWGLVPALGLWGVGWAVGRATGREALGLGDVKLLAALGLALGLRGALATLALASLQGAAVGALMVAVGGHRGAAGPLPPALADDAAWEPDPHAVPFGPFLVLGALQVRLFAEALGDGQRALAEATLRLFGG